MVLTWWQKPLRMIQTNLQVVDTPYVKPKELMAQLRDLGATAVLFNAGGIYAWYPTQVEGHTLNPWMEPGQDLLGEAVESAHSLGLKFFARLDFSKAEDPVFARHPDWFLRDPEGRFVIDGEPRPGRWNLLYVTCGNGPYRNEAVAIPVIKEILSRYPVDGLFLNAMHYTPCWCARCRRKYRIRYGEEMPPRREDFRPDWINACFLDNLGNLHRVIREIQPNIPWVGHYSLLAGDLPGVVQRSDVLACEPLDRLADGITGRPPDWWPSAHVRLGYTLGEGHPPLVIIHACPGLVWRHTTLPPAEYRFWLSQAVASGGNIWHSLTGVPDTQKDRRILPVIKEFNHLAEMNTRMMEGAVPVTPVALVVSHRSLVEPGGKSLEELYGWLEAFTLKRIPYTLIPEEWITPQRLQSFEVLVLPDLERLREGQIGVIARWVELGKGLIVTGRTGLAEEGVRDRLDQLMGLHREGEYLPDQGNESAYMRVEVQDHPLLAGLNDTNLIPLALNFQIAWPREGVEVPLTFVPPFAPPAGVGSPPERASIPNERTPIPGALRKDRVLYFACPLGRIIWRWRLPDHLQLAENAVKIALGQPLPYELSGPSGIQVFLFRVKEGLVLHLVNGVGSRPLRENLLFSSLPITLRLEEEELCYQVFWARKNQELQFQQEGRQVGFTLPECYIWEALVVKTNRG